MSVFLFYSMALGTVHEYRELLQLKQKSVVCLHPNADFHFFQHRHEPVTAHIVVCLYQFQQ